MSHIYRCFLRTNSYNHYSMYSNETVKILSEHKSETAVLVTTAVLLHIANKTFLNFSKTETEGKKLAFW